RTRARPRPPAHPLRAKEAPRTSPNEMSWMKRVSHRTRAVDPQRAAGDFTMVQAGRAIELGDDRRKLSADAPFVGTATQRFEGGAPTSPPARHEPGQWLDDEHEVPLRDTI